MTKSCCTLITEHKCYNKNKYTKKYKEKEDKNTKRRAKQRKIKRNHYSLTSNKKTLIFGININRC